MIGRRRLIPEEVSAGGGTRAVEAPPTGARRHDDARFHKILKKRFVLRARPRLGQTAPIDASPIGE